MEATEFSMNFCDNIKRQIHNHSYISVPHSCNSAIYGNHHVADNGIFTPLFKVNSGQLYHNT